MLIVSEKNAFTYPLFLSLLLSNSDFVKLFCDNVSFVTDFATY